MTSYKDIPKDNTLRPLFHRLETSVRECDPDTPLIVLRIKEQIDSVLNTKENRKIRELLEDILNNESNKFSEKCDCLKFDLSKKEFYSPSGRIYSVIHDEAEEDLKRLLKTKPKRDR